MKHEQGEEHDAEKTPANNIQLFGLPRIVDHVLGVQIKSRVAEHRSEEEEDSIGQQLRYYGDFQPGTSSVK